jgi:hypothetical protein
MKIKTALTLLYLCFFGLCANTLLAQRGLFIPANVRSMDIPFEYNNNLIVLQVVVNNRLPLRFIFDTGASHTIIMDTELSRYLGLKFERTFQVLGSDLSQTLTAHLAKNVRIDFSQDVAAPSEDVLVLEEDVFRFEEYLGVVVQGILSANVFSRYIFKINYDRRVITLYQRDRFGKSDTKGFMELPIEIFREKPYIYTTLTMAADSIIKVKLLIDSGAALPLLLFADTHPMIKPPDNAIPSLIGHGLGGGIDGYTGRVKQLDFGEHRQAGVITCFQVLDTIIDTLAGNRRNGVVGNGLLNRYVIMFDYHYEKVWIKPAKRYREAFVFDRSGLGIILSGPRSDTYLVNHIIPKSPAAEADIRVGDLILKIGRRKTKWMNLSAVIGKFQGDAGKKRSIVIQRNGQVLKKEIVLRDLL